MSHSSNSFNSNIIRTLTEVWESEPSIYSSLREYLLEASHGGWEGWSEKDLATIRLFLLDVEMYHDYKSRPLGKPPH